jgi:hypothetical protein
VRLLRKFSPLVPGMNDGHVPECAAMKEDAASAARL